MMYDMLCLVLYSVVFSISNDIILFVNGITHYFTNIPNLLLLASYPAHFRKTLGTRLVIIDGSHGGVSDRGLSCTTTDMHHNISS